MAYATDFAAPKSTGFFARLGAKLADMIETVALSSSRAQLIEELNNLTDAELAAKGLRRDDIVRHVFADKMYI
ncbi:hypothetical protein TRM7557_01544 [Tritonibacter multivorans]|uniref:DUF1127 domain-containing protein n=1 Tax=Tritonibacter multivorans TaxID=928856 RepID=A0A0P1G7U6_9RHOB|nr:hypothetical protein [Tritonibacter multivorans]MDA7422307.1 DUF1127 domain-containing protein [Tritonibacter multivorans]CUH77744.1 hypothetical protein TRM7557_01544 [Tritonibacter multivorans]SFD12803.1 hypothetical protein SAMN04488049_107103 [Tritonibacter multivorans]